MAVERKLERDIDLLLAEEFAVNPAFATWFFKQTLLAGGNYVVRDVWVSKDAAEGESDLIVLVHDQAADRDVAFFIEDKISAGFMPEQEARYRRRAERQQAAGDFEAFNVILCAPHRYPEGHPEAAGFDSFVSYEAIGAWLRAHDAGPRAAYRADFIETAASTIKNAWIRTDDPVTNSFWDEVYLYSTATYPEFELKKPRFSKGHQWLTLSPSLFPKGKHLIQILVKGSKGFVDLAFLYADAKTLQASLGHLLPTGMAIQQAGLSTVIRTYGRPFTVTGPAEEGLLAVKACLLQAKELFAFYRANEAAVLEAGRLAYAASQKAAEAAQ